MNSFSPIFAPQQFLAMEKLWKKAYPDAPWLIICWQQAWISMQAGHDYVAYDSGSSDENIKPPWGNEAALKQHLPIFILSYKEAKNIVSEEDFNQRWWKSGSPPWVLIQGNRQSDTFYRLYTAGAFRDECAINTWLAKRLTAALPSVSGNMTNYSNEANKHWVWQANQLAAINAAQNTPFLLLSGLPGSGKTSVLTQIIANAINSGVNYQEIAIATPSGKAAERINATLLEHGLSLLQATTLDFLLGLGFDGQPKYHAKRPLPYRLIVIDESSMVNTRRFAHLFRALPILDSVHQTLILCGDPFQLAAIEHGEVFHRLCEVGQAQKDHNDIKLSPSLFESALHDDKPTSFKWIPLLSNHRARHPSLLSCAQNILKADAGILKKWWNTLPTVVESELAINSTGTALGVFRVSEALSFERAVKQMCYALMKNYIDTMANNTAKNLEQSGLGDVLAWWQSHRILCAQNQGLAGTKEINRQCVNQLRLWHQQQAPKNIPIRDEYDNENMPLLNGLVVMLKQNIASLKLSNGTTGVVWQGQVWFERRSLVTGESKANEQITLQALPPSILAKCQLSFAITIHKAQGSEYQNVCLILPPTARVMSREVLYTGVTRAKANLYILSELETLIQALAKHERRRSAVGDSIMLNC